MPAPKDPIKREEWKKNISKGQTGLKRGPFSDEARKRMSEG